LETLKEQLPATIQQAEVTADQRALNVVPALIADLGDEAAWRYVEFFTANIRNPNTRRAYARACSRFFAWCEDRGLPPASIRPHDVATYIEQLQIEVSAPSVKQQLAAIRMLFNWLVTGQVVPTNPAASVRGPKHVVKTGKTPVLESAQWRKLLASIPDMTLRDMRDRALIATLTYSFARIGAALNMIEDDPVMLEAHYRRRYGNPALALDRHPVGAGAPPLAARTLRRRAGSRRQIAAVSQSASSCQRRGAK
jgi:hypothetical protein